MANHGYVTTKKGMTPKNISKILEIINSTYLNGEFEIEYTDCREEPGAWGKHVWQLSNPESGEGRVCWLNNARSFEIRHGGGSSYIWWVDFLIRNEIACTFDGNITDDAGGKPEKGIRGKCTTFEEYKQDPR